METKNNALATVLLVMDIQPMTIKMVGDNAPALTGALKKAIAGARSAGIPVIYVVVGFRKGFPELGSGSSTMFARLRQAGPMPDLEEPLKVDPSIAPAADEIVVTKRRVSAFAGSDLEVILRGHRFEHLVLAGVSTSGVVLSTVVEAADKDYRLSVLSDGCVDTDPEIHNLLMTKYFPRRGEVLTVEQWTAGLPK